MAYEITVGTCSECGGRVALSRAWFSTLPQLPRCTVCGAYPEKPYGNVIMMKKPIVRAEFEDLMRAIRESTSRRITDSCTKKITYIDAYKNTKRN